MIADVFVAAGNCTVNVTVEVLFEPKSSTNKAAPPTLYTNAPRAVIAPVHTGFVKDKYEIKSLTCNFCNKKMLNSNAYIRLKLHVQKYIKKSNDICIFDYIELIWIILLPIKLD